MSPGTGTTLGHQTHRDGPRSRRPNDPAETASADGIVSVCLGLSGFGAELRICGRRFDSSRGHSAQPHPHSYAGREPREPPESPGCSLTGSPTEMTRPARHVRPGHLDGRARPGTMTTWSPSSESAFTERSGLVARRAKDRLQRATVNPSPWDLRHERRWQRAATAHARWQGPRLVARREDDRLQSRGRNGPGALRHERRRKREEELDALGQNAWAKRRFPLGLVAHAAAAVARRRGDGVSGQRISSCTLVPAPAFDSHAQLSVNRSRPSANAEIVLVHRPLDVSPLMFSWE